MNDVSVVCRAYDAEAPYIRSFIDHYTGIGCKAFHIVVPQDNPCDRLLGQLNDYDHVTVYRDHGIAHFNEAQNAALPHVKTSHILWVDIDEYLNTEDVTPLLAHDYVNLPWIIAPYNLCLDSDHKFGLGDKQVKYIVRATACKELRVHDCVLKDAGKPLTANVNLLHYVYRSYADLFLRCTLGNYQSYQKTFAEQLREGADDCTKLPLKYKMLAIYQRLVTAADQTVMDYCRIDTEMQKELVAASAYGDTYAGLERSMLQYFSRIDLRALTKRIHAHPKYREFGRLPHFLLAELADATLMDSISAETFAGRDANSIAGRIGSLLGR